MKSFAFSLAFIMGFTAARKWPWPKEITIFVTDTKLCKKTDLLNKLRNWISSTVQGTWSDLEQTSNSGKYLHHKLQTQNTSH